MNSKFYLKAVAFGLGLTLFWIGAQASANETAPVDHFKAEAKLMTTKSQLVELAPGHRQWMSPLEILQISRVRHQQGYCAGFFDITDFQNETPVQPLELGLYAQRNPKFQTEVTPLLNEIREAELADIVNHLAKNFSTRYTGSQEGKDAALWVKSQFEKYAAGRSDISVNLFEHNFSGGVFKSIQPSVIAEIKGSGPLANEILIVGGHQDSINQMFFGGAPGADDNASGTAVVLETFRVLAASGFKPKRTLQFMTYAAEEIGLKGSQDIANTYKNQGKQVVGVLQFDMTMVASEGEKITLFTDHTNADLTAFLKILIDEYVKVKWDESQCGYGCSDHASWDRAGFPAAFPSEAPFIEKYFMNRIHTTSDTVSTLDVKHGSHFAKLAVAYMVEMGLE